MLLVINFCRIRRVKCDETKPACFRCKKLGHDCDGYPKTKRPIRIVLPQLQPDFQPIFYQPSTIWIQTQDEDRFFKFFTDSMVPQLAGFFESEPWNRLILQTCHQDVAVRKAVIAIAAYKSASDATQCRVRPMLHSEVQNQHQYALRQYSKAIRSAALQEKQDLRTT